MDAVNAKTKAFWSGAGGEFWVENQNDLDATLKPLGEAAMRKIHLPVCRSVLDIGCGTGRTTLDIVKQLTHGGKAYGLDISEPMLEKARILAHKEQVSDVEFSCTDVQVDVLADTKFDAAFSRFGVMFFDDSIQAFSNIYSTLMPNAVFSFVCWQAPSLNPWHAEAIAIVNEFIELPRPPDRSPGPFAFQDRDYIEHILTASGFNRISIVPLHASLRWFQGKDPYQAATRYVSINPVISQGIAALDQGRKVDVTKKLTDLFLSRREGDAMVFDSATWVVSALC